MAMQVVARLLIDNAMLSRETPLKYRVMES